MNTELAIALLTQAANYIALVGGYLTQTAAEMAAVKNIDRSTLEVIEAYNILGNQITNISLAMYCALGQFAIDLIIIQNNQALADSITNTSNDAPNTAGNGPQRKWSIKNIKKKRLRRWQVRQHYRP